MNRFDPPGFVDDLTEQQKDQWSQTISRWLDRARQGRPDQNDGPRSQFFNPLTTPPDANSGIAVISWNAFPRQVKASSSSDKERWRRADSSRDVQDEYCEWSVTRDPATRKITRVTFTCEGPEYWDHLAAVNPDKVLELYREFVSPAAKKADLFPGGNYDPLNRFNNGTTNGAMHLIQGANTLTAEIELGAAATIRRKKNGQEITGAQELILCSRYGEPSRNSDPFIGEQVNALARNKADITLNNPVGLYFHDFKPVGWVTPDGKDARRFWKFVRGKDDHFVRAVFEVPPGLGYVVGDIRIAGKPIEFGGQIADFITIKLEGLATRVGQSNVAPFEGCRGDQPAPPALVPAETRPAPLRSRLAGVYRAAAAPDGVSAETIAEKRLIERLPEALRAEAEVEAEDVGAAPPALLPYPKLPADVLGPRMVSGKIMTYSSPDSTFAVTKALLDSAQQSIVIGIYDFNADYVKEPLKSAMRRGVTVSLMLDTNSADDPGIFSELSALGARCVVAPSSSAGSSFAYFGDAHEKIIVIDTEIVMIQSGNWSENSIPLNEGDGVVVGSFQKGNRDMGMAIHSRDLARFFAELVARDMRLAEGLPPDVVPPAPPAIAVAESRASEIFFEAAPPATPLTLFSSRTFEPATPVRITPVITPENFHDVAKGFLRSATRSIRIEQQYIRGGQQSVEALLNEIDSARAAHPDLDVKIIVSPKFLTGSNRTKFLQAMDHHNFAFDDNYRFLASKFFVHCHNKLIVVDDEKALLGSQNWSGGGLIVNREASLLVEHAGVASRFGEIFDADWEMSEPTGAPPDALLTDLANGLVDAADFATGGVVISSVRDYKDV